MKKICIITNFRKTANYGGILQAYALNYYIRKIGFDCKTLSYSPLKNTKAFLRNNLFKPLKILSTIFDRLNKIVVRKTIKNRSKKFDLFRNEFIPHTEDCNQNNARDITDKFDVLICGSDQIWRPGLFNNEMDDVMWLKAFPDNQIKASYAASIGITQLDSKNKYYIEQALKGYKSVSVREVAAQRILQPLCNQKIETVVDPVFLLSKEDWGQIIKTPEVSENYIFVYFIKPKRKIYKCIEEYAKNNGLKIISIPYMSYKFNLCDYTLNGQKVLAISPQEFIGYIRNATYIVTDSFHCTAFSIIYHKAFSVYITNHGSRIESLLEKTKLGDRIILTGETSIIEDNIDDITWNFVDNCLLIDKEYAVNYLNNVLCDK